MAKKTVGRVSRGGVTRPILKAVKKTVGLTARRRKRFLEELAATMNIAASARAAGLQENTVYKARRTNAEFRQDSNAAIAEGYTRLEVIVLEGTIAGCAAASDGTARDDRRREVSMGQGLKLMALHGRTVATMRAQAAAEVAPMERGGEHPVTWLLRELAAMGERLGAPIDAPASISDG